MRSSSNRSRQRSEPDFDGLTAAIEESYEADGDVTADDESLHSFIVEVSAGSPDGRVTVRPSRRRWPGVRQFLALRNRRVDGEHPASRDDGGTPRDLIFIDDGDATDAAGVELSEGQAIGDRPAASHPRPKRVLRSRPAASRFSRLPSQRKRRQLPAWLSSVIAHSIFLGVLATASLATIEQPERLELAVSPIVTEEVVFEEVAVEGADGPDAPLDGVAAVEPTDLTNPGQAAFGGLSAESALEGAGALASLGGDAGVPGGGGLLGEVGGLFGAGGQGAPRFNSELGERPMAEFFGQEIEGDRIVFVLDNSGSMQGGRLETVIAELLRCVDSLREDQEFYVIFHSDMVYPLFYPDPVDRYVRPTAANKRMLARWLDSVELCLGDSVDEALAIAALIDPDAVYLLSDGRIQGDKTLRFMLDSSLRNFPIHTFAVGMGTSVAGRRNLADIAAANGGEFRESDVPDEMKELARAELRPYHSERPGPVWGRKVKPFRPRG